MPRLSKIGAAALAAFGWTSGVSAVTVDFLVVAGGGGGATAFGAGGGAGGFRTSAGPSGGGASAEAKLALNPTLSYTVIVGAGGNGALGSTQANNTNGSNSSISTITSTGGGAGGTNGAAGSTGGSGGAGGNQGGISAAAGAGTANQGFAGGTGSGSSSYGSGGGGGAGAIGGTGTTSVCGDGGVGVPSSISGTSTYYAGGGGGGATSVFGITTAGLGGNGGGGSGSNSASSWVGYAGEANKGGGGGGGGYTGTWQNGGQGGSGVVIISYVGAQQFGGGVVTSSGGNTIHTFTTSGTLSPLSSLTASYLIVAGGGGGSFGGAGAGGLLSGSSLTIDTNSIYAVTVGAGGAGQDSLNTTGTNGSNSAFSMVSTAAVGGGGGGKASGTLTGNSGGSGGGGGNNGAGGSGTSGQGNAGGNGYTDGATYGLGGGGGGASAAGQSVNSGSSTGGNGGAGSASSISGTSTTYAGGGGGGGHTVGSRAGGTGGSGGGGNGSTTGNASSGTNGLGGGGGGAGSATGTGGNGGSGVVIISYPGSTQQMAGGTVTVAGGNVIHTFTSSGYLTPIVLVNNSLRFRESASSYLNRTPTTAGNNQKFTMSVWYKPGNIGTSFTNANFISAGGDGSNIIIAGSGAFGSTVDNRFLVRENNATAQFYWPMVFRDPAAWYHIVLAVDTTQTNSNNRAKLYVNGVDQGAFSGTGYSLSATTSFNTVTAHYIGAFNSAYYYTSCYFAEYNWIDGQQLTANSFGTSNGLGVWQPIRYGGSYGTNGFYLPFNAGTSTFIGSYNGSTAWFNAANNAAFAFGTGSLTIEAWVYPTQNSYGAIFDTRSTGSGGPGVSIYANSGNGIILVNNTTYNPSTYLSLNQWSHIAAVRNGASSWTVYINGNSVLTFTDSSNLTDNACFSGKNYAGNFWFGGFISNLRVVKGTAVYTSNFTPATSPLTNISGTSLLTLQNSTLIDNSTNAFSLTNTGPITTLGAYIFNFLSGTFKDNSPQGNNWTYNNISTAFGSSCDLMNDVPTLTSATTANYCVLSPLSNPNAPIFTLSNGNLNYSCSASAGNGAKMAVISTMALHTGKVYWEILATNTNGGYGVSSELTVTNVYGLANANVYSSSQASTSGITYSGTTFTYTTNDTLGFAWDGTALTLGCYKNGALIGTFSGFSATTVYFPQMQPATASASTTFSANFGQQPFAQTPPTGFVALNTFNLPTPTIGATASTTANKYFDATLYTGNSGTQSITNSGFMQPDFVWLKSRSNALDHGLFDSVRGVQNVLASNGTGVANYGGTGELTAFNSNGFTLVNSGSYQTNQSGYTYVAWQWRASNATAVTNTNGSIISTVSANTTAGFSIVTYTGNGTGGSTVGHGCQVNGIATAPSMIIYKRRTGGSDSWIVYHASVGAANSLTLNNTNGVYSGGGTYYWGGTAPTNLVFSVATDSAVNTGSSTYVAYCFAEVAGYSKIGSYTGTGAGDSNGPFIYCGFRPAFILLKADAVGYNWAMMDTDRPGYNSISYRLFSDVGNEETTVGDPQIDFLSNGFKLRAGISNYAGTIYFIAFAENHFKYANAR